MDSQHSLHLESQLLARLRFAWRALLLVGLLGYAGWKYQCAFDLGGSYFWSWFIGGSASLLMAMWFGRCSWRERCSKTSILSEVLLAVFTPQLVLEICRMVAGQNSSKGAFIYASLMVVYAFYARYESLTEPECR